MYNNLTERQQELLKAVQSAMKDMGVLDNALANHMALLCDVIESTTSYINEHGEVIQQVGDKGQIRHVANPAMAQREAAIKNFNIHIRTLKIDSSKVDDSNELAKFLSR
ncbi:hypothetical protein JCM19241_5975 [Vibrio ishigakensis]|uniref:Uncharacterized protein n=1 Tax=Vibrio ishigakensis TaxID=1481914 RepID=A0A0B8QS58_9VIBR|nr:hypothetical protein JCM19241_5975 [Vibrio ishigakensis]